MLSRQLQGCFAALGARLKVRTEPKGSFVRLAIRQDSRGDYFQLVLPRLSRRLVSVLTLQPRHKRMLLRLGNGERYLYVLVQMQPEVVIRTLQRKQAKRMLASAGQSERPQAA